LRSVKFSVAGASRISATCGGVSGTGITSVNLRELPAGTCRVEATVGGQSASTTVSVTAPGGIQCTFSGGALSCP
jgi:hypothetical protein